MNNLPLELKYNIISWIFDVKTIEYLMQNNYNFKPDLHKYTLRLLIDHNNNSLIYEDLLLNGLYDDNYYWVHNFKFNKNKQSYDNFNDLLFMMIKKNSHMNIKYFKGISNSNKKNLNLIDKKYNVISLFHYIKAGYTESFLCDLIGTTNLLNIGLYLNKKSNILDLCWNKKYDKLFSKILQLIIISSTNSDNDTESINSDNDTESINSDNNESINSDNDTESINSDNDTESDKLINYFINKINKNNYNEYSNYLINSIPLIYKLIQPYIIKINQHNLFFYLNVTKKYFPEDYKKVLESKYIFNYVLDNIMIIGLYYSSKSNTDISQEILKKTTAKYYNELTTNFNEFTYDILESGLIKCYKNVINGIFHDDILPIVINLIITSNKLDIRYKNLEDFSREIKPIIPQLIANTRLDQIKFDLLINSLNNKNDDFAVAIINKINFNEFYHLDPYRNKNPNPNDNDKNEIIINECLKNDLDKLIIFLIIKSKIILIYGKNLNNTFLELLFIKKKFELVNLILFDEKICEKYNKSKLVNNILFLSCVFNRAEIFYDLFENYFHCIDIKTLYSSEFYSNNQSCLMYLIQNKMDGPLDWIMENYITKTKIKIDFKIIDNKGNSLITWLLSYNYHKYVDKIINEIGQEIFKHIPMFVLNNANLYNYSQLSNGLELYWACKKNLNNIAWFFVSNKLGKINYFDSDGNSCLILACMGRMETIAGTLLCSITIDYNKKNNLGKTALDYAKQNNMIKICQLIQEKIKYNVPSNINSNFFTIIN